MSNTKIMFSIVTPTFNSEEYLEECILSIKSQSYKNLEHIIVDGGSTDGTLNIIKRYEGTYNMRWISEKDDGMYDAISKGFSMAKGDVFSWLNSDDMYMPWTCAIVAAVMKATDIQWCTGIPCHYNPEGISHNVPRITPVYPQSYIRKGYMDGRVATFVQQESMFWKKELWIKSGYVLSEYKMAGDYHLWREFAKDNRLVVLDSIISGFRIHEGQKSSDRDKYYSEIGELTLIRKILAKTKIVSVACLIESIFTHSLRIRTKKFLK
ncbi:glycosyltransferase family 2 protein [Neobacillus vireti]|uniref:glycosyltransferase family 2 protein n=1 Tax=Neobacillus vireti TaxID=220686 RepID=UPI002FFE7ED2